MNYRQFLSELRRGKAACFLLYGEETFLLEKARLAVRAQMKDAWRETASLDQQPEAYASMSSGSLFGEATLYELVGNRLPGANEPRKFDALMALIDRTAAPSALLIALYGAGYEETKKAAFRKISEKAVVMESPKVGGEAMPAQVRDLCREAEIEMEGEAVNFLAEAVEGNLAAAHQEITKMSLANPGEKITLEIAQKEVMAGARYGIFDLEAAIEKGDAARALKTLRHLRHSGVDDNLIMWPIIRLLRCAAAHNKGRPPPGPRHKGASLARALGDEGITRALRDACTVDFSIKGAAAGDARVLQTRLVWTLANA